MKKKGKGKKKTPSSEEQLRVSALAKNDGQVKTKEPLAQDLIPWARNRLPANLLSSVDKIDRLYFKTMSYFV